VLAALSTDHKIGLGVVGAIFIAFALTSSFLAPRRRADFPGPNGLSVFVIVSFVLFAAMLTAVEVFGAESEPKSAHAGAEAAPVAVTEREFQIALPSTTLKPGRYTFTVKNAGKLGHDLVFEGPGISGREGTPLIAAGGTAKVTVALAKGAYTLYCSVDGHRQAGMVAKLTVG
jgi:plastocyanin